MPNFFYAQSLCRNICLAAWFQVAIKIQMAYTVYIVGHFYQHKTSWKQIYAIDITWYVFEIDICM